jgi:hypothetical protein
VNWLDESTITVRGIKSILVPLDAEVNISAVAEMAVTASGAA